MRKGHLLNSNITSVIARMGHGDHITIADAGLPIDEHCERIDLALTKGFPAFMDVLEAIIEELQVEHAILSTEIKTHNQPVHIAMLNKLKALERNQGNKITLEYQTHHIFKERSKASKAVIRSGECTPYANIILIAGTIF